MKIQALPKLPLFCFIVFCCVVVDFFSKSFFVNYFKASPFVKITIFPFWDFVLVKNKGVSFSLFNGLNHVVLSFITVLALLVIGFYIVKNFKGLTVLEYFMYAFILGGGLGNIIGRIANGSVVDFISIHLFGYYFPVFNFADIFITIAMFIFLYDNFIVKRRKG